MERYESFLNCGTLERGNIYGKKIAERIYSIYDIEIDEEGYVVSTVKLNLDWFTNEEIDDVLNEASSSSEIDNLTIKDVMSIYFYYKYFMKHPILNTKIASMLYYCDEIFSVMEVVAA